MKNTLKIAALVLNFSLMSTAFASKVKPLALVWNGEGVCQPGCDNSAADVAKKAGFRVQYVNEKTRDFSFFDTAKLWVQPGGVSVTAMRAMGPVLMQQVREFVAGGGGYIGFCAGAFSATTKIGTTEKDGLGLMGGETELYKKGGDDHAMYLVKTKYFGKRWMYYAGGPFIKISDDELAAMKGEVIANYPDGSVAGVRGHYGKGKVAVVGFHPEATRLWKLAFRKWDKDGSDKLFAVDMATYATTP